MKVMLIKEMFQKEIDRDIRGVIKADQTDEDDVHQELEEYVVTKELLKHFNKFYENYLKSIDGNTDKVGVWISGFFGSGKSHFLKILSYLLANKKVKGNSPVDYFADKIEDPILYANMQRVASVPTETILFNIDSKSPLDNKTKDDAILRVLIKVFYEHQGYYGNNPVVAELEKFLDREGNLEKFKEEFAKVAPDKWENRRNTFGFDSHFVKEALLNSTNMTEEAIDNWLSTGIDHIDISIERFAKEVKEYIDQKGPDFHLVFLIDEIGQYIGDRRDLMLNLQTVTENLGAICNGQAWVMVTSQESIDSIVKVKGDDFSRIQGRFDTRLSLSSVSVDEVIQKRILDKKDFAQKSLEATYPNKGPILRNVISFRDSTADLRGYEGATEFANVYPFVPYQFVLLQNIFEQIRKHSASEKHISEGERSMLSAYREAGMRYMNEEEGILVPLYAFYDTIQEFLQPVVSRVIERAAQNAILADDSFNNDLLKVLFMIKYVKEIPSNIDNIATLMVTHIDQDMMELKKKIKTSLKKLESQTLIQKDGDQYIFLTDDEQDINREIKAVKLDDSTIKKSVAEYIFQDLYYTRKYAYSKVYDFSFNQKMDEINYGSQTSSIGLNVISPLSEHYHKSDQELRLLSSGNDEVLLKLSGDGDYIDEIEEALKIEAYRQSQRINQLPENIQNILNNKQVEMRERRRRARDLIEEAIKQGQFFMNGSEIDVRGSSVRDKINEAFKALVENTYKYLSYVKSFTEQENELLNFLKADESQVVFEGTELNEANEQARQAIDEFIRMQSELSKQVRVKILYDRFSIAPYGWRELDIAYIIAGLLKDQHIRISYNAEYLHPREDANKLMTIFTKSVEADKAIITLRQKVDERTIRITKQIVRDLFDKTDLPSDEDGLILGIRELIEEQTTEINEYKMMYQGRPYPGMSLLDKGLEYFEQFGKKLDNKEFLDLLIKLEDDLYYWFEDIVNVKSFFNSNQQQIFDEGLAAYEKYDEVKAYLEITSVTEAMEELQNILNEPIPYKMIKDIPKYINTFKEEIEVILTEKKEQAKIEIESDYDELKLQLTNYGISDETKDRIEQQYKSFLQELIELGDVHRVDAMITRSNQSKRQALKDIRKEIEEWQRKKEEEQRAIAETEGKQVESVEIKKPVVQKEEIRLKEIMDIKTLRTEEDVDLYIRTLERKLRRIIEANKEIEFID